MPGPFSITTRAEQPSIVIIQGAYLEMFEPVANTIPQSTLATEPVVIEDWLKFQSLVSEWREQRSVTSSITAAANCCAYQSIIGMGPDVIPLILAQLESEGDEPDQWFWALKAITCHDPVRPDDRGDFAAMAHAWLQWGRDEGYAW